MECKHCKDVGNDLLEVGEICSSCDKDLRNAKYFYCEDGREHFCSKKCFYDYCKEQGKTILIKVKVLKSLPNINVGVSLEGT